ncbi:hypothetical protein C2869_18545 [Saccharobesus litoralis]|uniref:LPS-assembly lipoprotein LptE n=1 Tax=Saccharobesus litoralis TaxID=2172099 RepID=A0A2S0VW08_9ALTE|nr:LPS assembly lipoprotein LptE [Saccharobesus litoralis]AWB68290.1 hypothetical protein C2869_18545 [Saccharobesus litoralis]
MLKSFQKSLTKLISLITLMSLVTSCGFQLRGSYEVPAFLKNICMDSRGDKLLRVEVKEQLVIGGINIDNPALCARLSIIDDKLERRTLSLFPNGQVAEYELIYSVVYLIEIGESQPRRFSVEILRDYQDNPDAVLAKNREMNLILKEMRKDAASRIVRQLASIRY